MEENLLDLKNQLEREKNWRTVERKIENLELSIADMPLQLEKAKRFP